MFYLPSLKGLRFQNPYSGALGLYAYSGARLCIVSIANYMRVYEHMSVLCVYENLLALLYSLIVVIVVI